MGQSQLLRLIPGEIVSYQGNNFVINKIIDLYTVIIESSINGKLLRVQIKELQAPIDLKNKDNIDLKHDLIALNDKDWEEAQRKFSIIKPIVENSLGGDEIIKISKQNNIHISTIYRWIKKYYDYGGTVSALLNHEKSGGKGKSRLNEDVEILLQSIIEENYLNNQKKSIKQTYIELLIQCKNLNIIPPHFNTLRNRILSLSEEYKLRKRYGKHASQYKYEPLKGNFPNLDNPLNVVQIDHTPIDIICVDDEKRESVGRPWLTMAIDVYSRMVVGIYLSYDPPGALAAGMCIANSILTKDIYLSKLGINEEWPCWGVMQTLHMDNAKEFRGHMLERASKEYNIELVFRPVRQPHWGGHIERLLGTVLNEIHALPGTTFSNSKKKGDYKSEDHASLTIFELEKWIVTFLTSIYHKRIHSTLGMSPLTKFNEGIFGNGNKPAKGLPARIYDERKVRLDFMPFVERTIQEYGVLIDYIFYYHECLRKWIHAKNDKGLKSNNKRKFVFKRDPRDISVIFFYDPELKQYFNVPYRDTSKPPITLWEHKEIVRKLENSGVLEINENLIFEAYKKLKDIEDKAVTKTKQIKALRRKTKKLISQQKSIIAENISDDKIENQINTPIIKQIKPFENIEDGTPF